MDGGVDRGNTGAGIKRVGVLVAGVHAAQRRVRFLDTAGTITSDGDTITVTLNRRAYSPVLRQSALPADTTVP